MKTINSKQAKKEHNALKSHWSDESHLSQKIMIAILEKLENIEAQSKRHRKPSKYNLFVQEQTKKGLTMQEATELYRKKFKGAKQ